MGDHKGNRKEQDRQQEVHNRAGSEDEQRPHGEEEVYLILEGKGRFKMGDEDVVASPGSLLTVPARVEHRFHSIEQDLLLLVFFAPAEGSAKKEAPD